MRIEEQLNAELLKNGVAYAFPDSGNTMEEELLLWLKEQYSLLYLNEYDLKIESEFNTNILDDVFNCSISNSLISQCKVSYPEALI